MSWLRLDDNFAQHPKFEGWTGAQKWAFLELMSYCAKYRTAGRVPTDLSLLPRSVTSKLIGQAEIAGWLERHDDALWIHDWQVYNPQDVTAASRQKRYRNRNANRNEDRNGNGASRVGARARPVPSPTPEQPPAAEEVLSADRSVSSLPVDKELSTARLLEAIGPHADGKTPDQVRALATLLPQGSIVKVCESVGRAGVKNRAAYAVMALQSEIEEQRCAG